MAEEETNPMDDLMAEFADDESAAKLIQAGVERAMGGIEVVIGTKRYQELLNEVEEARTDQFKVIPESQWSEALWRSSYAAGVKDFSEMPEALRKKMARELGGGR